MEQESAAMSTLYTGLSFKCVLPKFPELGAFLFCLEALAAPQLIPVLEDLSGSGVKVIP